MHKIFRFILPGLLIVSFVLSACAAPAGAGSKAAPVSTLTVDQYYDNLIIWMDKLKTCTPYEYTYVGPFTRIRQNDAILGMQGDLCQVSQETVGKFTYECRYTADGIKVMTQDLFYEQAKERVLNMSGDDVSEVLANQCTVTVIATPIPINTP